MFMNQNSSLKSLVYYYSEYSPEAKICLTDLTELKCCSNICSEFFYKISQICHNIQSLTIGFEKISDGLADLISLQKTLKSVTLISSNNYNDERIKVIISSLIKSSSTITKLILIEFYTPLSFITKFTNLQVLIISCQFNSINDFDQLQYVNFPQLKVLKFLHSLPSVEILIKFLEINGKNLTEFYADESFRYNDDSLNLANLAIAKFCPNLKILSTTFKDDESETLKLFLNICQYLEIIKGYWSNIAAFFEILAKYPQKKFYSFNINVSYSIPARPPYEDLEENFRQERPSYRIT